MNDQPPSQPRRETSPPPGPEPVSDQGNAKKGGWFANFAKATSSYAGKPMVFGIALAIIILWAVSGPFFGYSDTWQLVINTGTTIITFLMVFLIQNSQNRDSTALQLKLDELIRVQKKAHNSLIDLEDQSEEEIERLRKDFVNIAEGERQSNGNPQPEEKS